MPEQPFTYEAISRRVTDRVYGKSILCQIATWESQSVKVINKALWLELGFDVVYHELTAAGTPGIKVPPGKGVMPWHQTLYANNNCVVYMNLDWTPTAAQPQDPRNGQVLYYLVLTPEGETWERRPADGTRTPLVGGLATAPEPWMRQGDAFSMQMRHDMNLTQLISYHLEAANLPPYSKFA